MPRSPDLAIFVLTTDRLTDNRLLYPLLRIQGNDHLFARKLDSCSTYITFLGGGGGGGGEGGQHSCQGRTGCTIKSTIIL